LTAKGRLLGKRVTDLFAFVRSRIMPGVVETFEKMMTEGMIKVISSTDSNISAKIEIVSALERGCQYMYSGDPRKLLRTHLTDLGIKFRPTPHIPATTVDFSDNVRISREASLAPTWMTAFNTKPMLKHYNQRFFNALEDGNSTDSLLLEWINILTVRSSYCSF
jgi:hypothetical protein